MAWKNDQFLPPSDVKDAVINLAIKPAVISACERLGVLRMGVQVNVWVFDQPQDESYIFAWGMSDQAVQINAHVRLRFRSTVNPKRSLFYAQLGMNEPDKKTGFAGLIIRGEVKVNADQIVVDTTSCTSVYNQSNWIDPATL